MDTVYEGALNATKNSMRIKPKERVVIVTDNPTYDIGKAFFDANSSITPFVEMYVLSDSEKKLHKVPNRISRSLAKSDAAFWATDTNCEYALEDDFVEKTLAAGSRDLHMSGIEKKIVKSEANTNYNEIDRLTKEFYRRVYNSKEIRVKGEYGNQTDLTLIMNPSRALKSLPGSKRSRGWVMEGGIINKGDWQNLPMGEVCEAPYDANGYLNIELFGDHFDRDIGIQNPPASIEVKDGWALLNTLNCPGDINKELTKYLKTDNYSSRISEIGIPTNYKRMKMPLTGNLLADEKRRTHVAFGDRSDELNSGDWSSETHLDCLLGKCTVTADGKDVLVKGLPAFKI